MRAAIISFLLASVGTTLS